MIQILHWLSHAFGLDNLSGPWYGFWSGAGSDIGEVAIVGAVLGAYRKHSCHVSGCIRLAKHPVNGTPYVVCAKHHPDVPDRVTAEHIQAQPDLAQEVRAQLTSLTNMVTDTSVKVDLLGPRLTEVGSRISELHRKEAAE